MLRVDADVTVPDTLEKFLGGLSTKCVASIQSASSDCQAVRVCMTRWAVISAASEMVPDPDAVVTRGPDGLRTSELRMGFYRA